MEEKELNTSLSYLFNSPQLIKNKPRRFKISFNSFSRRYIRERKEEREKKTELLSILRNQIFPFIVLRSEGKVRRECEEQHEGGGLVNEQFRKTVGTGDADRSRFNEKS